MLKFATIMLSIYNISAINLLCTFSTKKDRASAGLRPRDASICIRKAQQVYTAQP